MTFFDVIKTLQYNHWYGIAKNKNGLSIYIDKFAGKLSILDCKNKLPYQISLEDLFSEWEYMEVENHD